MKIIISLVLIFALSFSLIGYGEEQITNNPPANGTQGGANMESIWNLTDTNEFVIAMTEHLAEKTHYGEDMSVLSEAERIFYISPATEGLRSTISSASQSVPQNLSCEVDPKAVPGVREIHAIFSYSSLL